MGLACSTELESQNLEEDMVFWSSVVELGLAGSKPLKSVALFLLAFLFTHVSIHLLANITYQTLIRCLGALGVQCDQ